MFKVTSDGSDGFSAIMKMIVTLNDEGCFVFKPEGVDIKCMDVSKFAMVDCFWPKEKFKVYECDEETKLGINFNEFHKVISRADRKDDITLTLSSGGLVVKVGESKKYDMRLLAVDYVNPPTPKFNTSANFKMEASNFIGILEDVEIVNRDYVTMESKEGTVKILGHGDTGDCEIASGISSSGDAKSMYSIPYMKNTIKPIQSLISSVDFGFSERMPMKLSLNIDSIGVINYYMAPKAID